MKLSAQIVTLKRIDNSVEGTFAFACIPCNWWGLLLHEIKKIILSLSIFSFLFSNCQVQCMDVNIHNKWQRHTINKKKKKKKIPVHVLKQVMYRIWSRDQPVFIYWYTSKNDTLCLFSRKRENFLTLSNVAYVQVSPFLKLNIYRHFFTMSTFLFNTCETSGL